MAKSLPNLFQNEFPTLPNSSKIEPQISPKVRFLYFWSNSSITLPISSKIVSKNASKIMTEVFQIVISGQISAKSLPQTLPKASRKSLQKLDFSIFGRTLPSLYVEKLFQNHDRSLPNSDLWPNLFQNLWPNLFHFPTLPISSKIVSKKLFQNHDRSLPNSDLWPNLFHISSKMNSQLSQSLPKSCRKTLPKS